MSYYHSSKIEHPIGRVLTGPATRGIVSQWCDKEPTFDGRRVYLWVGDGDPRSLSTTSISPDHHGPWGCQRSAAWGRRV